MMEYGNQTNEPNTRPKDAPVIATHKNLNLAQSLQTSKNVKTFYMLLLYLFVGIIVAVAIKNPQLLFIKAGINTAKISLAPATADVTTGTTLQVWMKTQKPVGFARIEILFSSTFLTLTQEVDTSGIPLTMMIMKTSMAEANATGKIILTVALDPKKTASAPTGNVKLADLTFAPKVSLPNVATSVNISPTAIQIVGLDTNTFVAEVANATLTLNPTTPTPAPSPIPSPSITPEPTLIEPKLSPLPTVTPVHTPTPMPSATPLPNPTNQLTPTGI